MSAGSAPGLTGVDTFVDVGGLPTWYTAHGSGRPLVYLHGGFGDGRELEPAVPAYAAHFRVFAPDRRGHGRTPDVPGPFTFEAMAADTIGFLESVVGGPAYLVGYSDGATTALHVALRRPDLVRSLVLMSGQFHHTGLLPGMFGSPETAAADMVGSPIEQSYAEVSPDGAAHFPVVAAKIVEMALTCPTLEVDQLREITARTLVLCADDDVVRMEHTLQLYRALPNAELAVVPGTSHLHVEEKPELVTRLVLGFLTEDPVATIVPVRRAAHS
jgi:pimeloyl-ACP methyl ester carboxylesterase